MGRQYRFKTKPYKHQVRALRKLMRSDFGGALLMDPRTGKTKTTIDYMSMLYLKDGLKKVVVVCPSRVMGVWVEEIHKHSPYICNVVVWDARARKTTPLPDVNGYYDLTIVVVNYEAFATPGRTLPSGKRSKTTGRFKFRRDIHKWIGGDQALCVLDESHKIKSPSGKAANMLVSMGPYFSKRAILTGTPVTKAKRAHDIYMQWKFLNPERFSDTPTAGDFKEEYGRWITDPEQGYQRWVGSRNQAKLHKRIHMDAFAVHREDCFDLPPREDIKEFITLRGETARVYDEMAEEMVALLEEGEITEASIALVKALRLSQITGGTANTPEGKTFRIGVQKINALKPHLEDAIEREEKLVICARFKADLNIIARTCEEMGIKHWQLRGGVKRADGDEYIRQFRRYDGCGVFIMQPASGSLGIDLSTSAKMIWYSLTPSFVQFSQACDRIALSRNSTTFVYILAKGTIDEVMLSALKEDGDVAKAITSNPRKLLRMKGNS